MIWEIETDTYAAALKVDGVEDLRLKRDSYGVEGSSFWTHNGHDVLSFELYYAEDYDGNELSEIDYDEAEIIESIVSCHFKI